MVVNFRAREISRGARKLIRIPTLIIIIKKNLRTWSCLGTKMMVKVCWLAKATFFPIASVFHSLLLCSCLSLLGFFFFFFLLSLILFVSLCSYSSSVFFFLPVFFFILVSLSSWFLCVCVWLVRSTTCSEGKLKFLFS